jgi:hypothetical protein
VRLGVVLDVPEAEAPLAALSRQAAALEDRGIEVAWLEEGPRTGPPLITAAALGTVTRYLRLVACVRAGEHPLAIAEAATVADNCSNGRLALVLAGDDALEESLAAVKAALSARPFRHAGPRWTIPANRPENDGATERIVVTPPSVQLELPVWTGVAPDPLETGPDGSFDADALVARLRTSEQGLAVLRLPETLSLDARIAAIAQLATFVSPRVVQMPLPDGLEAYWSDELADQIRRLPSP